MNTAVLGGFVILVLPWLWRWLTPERDWYLLAVAIQALVYAFIAPMAVAMPESVGTQAAYATVMGWVAIGFCAPLSLAYLAQRKKHVSLSVSGQLGIGTSMAIDGRRLRLWSIATGGLALWYLWVALSNGLLFRRLGHSELAAAQLALSPLELAPYRLYLLIGPWCIAVLVFAWLRLREDQRDERLFTTVALSIAGGIFALHSIINSRLVTLLFLAFLGGFFAPQVVERIRGSILRVLILAMVIIGGSTYVMGVVENVRYEFEAGRSIMTPRILLPGGSRTVAIDQRRSERLDGIGLIVKIRPTLLREGPALGAAWAIPFVAAIEPVFPTELGRRLKAAALTTSKSILLLRYAGEAAEDTNSSLLSDAYGNVGTWGFVIAGLLLGTLLGLATTFVQTPSAGWQPVVGFFVLWMILPFEQEFANILFGWLKLAPVVIVGAWLTPVRFRLVGNS